MFKFSRILIIYAIAAPMALLLGYLVSSPNKLTVAVIALVLFFLALPIFINWHHGLMILFWNSIFIAGFLPGSPDLWLVFALMSFTISSLNHVMFHKGFLHAPELTWPLLFLAVLVTATAWYRGGIGLRALGGATFGGRYYVFILMGIAGYFALTAERIPISKGPTMGTLFFLSGTTSILSNLVFVLGPAFYIFYYLLPTDLAVGQAASEFGMTNIDRITGFGAASIASLCFLLARYGIRGLMDWFKPWRLFFLVLTVVGALFAGFRSVLMTLMLIFMFQFLLEGLVLTRYLPALLAVALLSFAPILYFSNKMPPVVQRAISFLPVKVDSNVLADARASTEWRLEMWSVVLKEVPKYLVIGKGYGIDPTELFLVNEAQRLGIATSPFEGFLLAGDYHSGPLSVIMPFGVFGAIGFLWTLAGGYRVLYLNYRHGDFRLRKVNTLLLAYYLANCVSFFFIFGALTSQLYIFLGACGLSVSLNGGVRRRSTIQSKPAVVPQALALEPS